MVVFPEQLPIPKGQWTSGTVPLRFEDITQDGRVRPAVMPNACDVVWGHVIVPSAFVREGQKLGMAAILSRLIVERTEATTSLSPQPTAEGGFYLAHQRGDDGEVQRIYMNIDAEMRSISGRMFGPRPSDAGQQVTLGRVFAEHVITRPFGPLEDRKVLSLPFVEDEPVPPQQYAGRRGPDVLALPDGGEWTSEWARDASPIQFTLDYTDSNQHVNSLVYPRLFIDSAARRLAAACDRDAASALMRRMELMFRKPYFAGQRAWVWTRAFATKANVGVVGVFAPYSDELDQWDSAKPHVYVCTEYDR